jgi:hypothetical protein
MATSADGPGGVAGPGDGPLGADERAELAALRRRASGHPWWRTALSALLVTLAAVLAPLSAVAVWVADEMGDTGRYVATVAPLARDPDVRAAVTDRVTDAAMAKIDLGSLLAKAAPSDRPRLEQALWEQLNRQAHTAFTGALTGRDDTAVRVRGDAVVLDLEPVVAQVKERLLGRGLAAASVIPEVRTEYTLVRSKDVQRAQTTFRLLQIAGNWLPVVTVVAAAAGVLLAAHRRRVLVAAALGTAAGLAVLGIGLSVFRIVYLDHLPVGTNEAAAGAVYDQLTRFLRVTVRVVTVLGVLVALGAWLSGAGRWATRVRRAWETGIGAVRQAVGPATTGPVGPWVHRHRYALRWAVVGGAGLAVLLWSGPTGQVVLWIALAALGVLAVVEFLDEGGGGGTAEAGPA